MKKYDTIIEVGGNSMNKFIISCGSAVDLTLEHLKQRNIDWLPFSYYIDEVEYEDDFGQSIKLKDFYEKIKKGSITKTSQINEMKYFEKYEKYFKEGYDVVCVCLSSGISGTYNSALIAKQELEAKYPERTMFVIDSLAASSGYGLLVDYLADLRDKGYSALDLVNEAENIKRNIQHLFFSTDFTCYVRGGRVSKTMGIVGTILKICPILHVDNDGKLVSFKKVRTKKRAIIQIVDEMEKILNNNLDYDGKCYISHSNSEEDAKEIKKNVENKFPNLKNKVKIYEIGTTIGSHSGPGTCALFFIGGER